MILCTPEQFAQCVEVYKTGDSVIDSAYTMLKILNLEASDITGEEWCNFMDRIYKAAGSSCACIQAPEPHTCTCSCHDKASALPPNVARMYELCDGVASTYARKNADYGDSFHTSVTKYGTIAALTRMSDKWNRLENLILHGQGQVDEAVTDTLVDLAAYALMTVMELEK